MTQRNQRSQRTLYLAQIAILAAILFLLEITGLGFLRIGPVSMTIMMVPVIIGAIVLGPLAGAILGAVFGFTSFSQALFAKDPLGAALLGVNPMGMVITTIVARVLMGWLCGLVYRALQKTRLKNNAALVFSSLSGALLNTLLFMSMFLFFFFQTPQIQEIALSLGASNAFLFAVALVGWQGLAEAGLSALLGSTISAALLQVVRRKPG